MSGPGTTREISLPATALVHLRRAFEKEAGSLETVHACHDAGFATGAQVFEQFAPYLGPDPSGSPESAFWSELDRFFSSRGWGSLTHERIHPGLSVLRSSNWGESDESSDDRQQPGCAFTSGVLAHVLGRVADGPVAVLEAACRSRGDPMCSFVFGSEGAIHDLYGFLLDGDTLETALSRM